MHNEYSSGPLEQLRAWLNTDVVALATASADGAPSVRMVLLKEADERGWLFFTSYTGRKGRELAVSNQSEPVESREVLEARFAQFDTTHPGEIPRPAHWGGFRLIPETYEFWEHEENRLHDRIRYRRDGSTWIVDRLQP